MSGCKKSINGAATSERPVIWAISRSLHLTPAISPLWAFIPPLHPSTLPKQYAPFASIPLLFLLAYSVYRCAIFERQLERSFASGLSGAMASYAAAPVVKAALDRLQVALECCGDRGYRDWMTIDWTTALKKRNGQGLLTMGECCERVGSLPNSWTT